METEAAPEKEADATNTEETEADDSKKEETEAVDAASKDEAAKEEKAESSEEKDKEDDGGEEDDGSAHRFRMDSGLLAFPEKLMALLDGDHHQVSSAMWWLPDGDAFCLVPSVFAEKVLDQHFSGTKFESFTRKLNRW